MSGRTRNGGSLKHLLIIYLCVMITVPALWTLVHGEAEVNDQTAPTPDKTLRSNEQVASKTDDEVIAREEEQINPDGLSVKERKLLEERGEKHVFQAEVNKLMNIIINSLYSNSEIFLREVISNASDALDKIRFLSLTDQELMKANPKLEIRIKADEEAKTLTITDTGIGMTKEQLINNLGTIAKSGTTEFLKAFQAGGDTSLIGQFGVGFYSIFLVADKVTVTSKNNEDKQHIWISDAQSNFTILEDPRGNTIPRGTVITLHMKEEAEDFLRPERIQGLVAKYSEFINYPIYFWDSKVVQKEVALTEEEIAEQNKKDEKKDDEESETVSLDEEKKEETADSDEEEKPKTKTENVTEWDWTLMNETKPLWTRPPKEITDEEYDKFYEAISRGETEKPLMHIHFLAEGEIEFKSLLYIPASPPSNMFEGKKDTSHRGLKLYVRRVFITDEFRDILPKYLSFIKGVVDSDDLPLNVSREMLQESKTLKIIKKKIVRKAIAMFQQLSEEVDTEKYNQFWKNYGQNIKLGVIEDPTNKQRLSQLMMFKSSRTGELSSLQKYVDRMKEGQKQIYFLACERLEECKTSPLAEKLVANGFEIMYMIDPIDEYTINSMERFDGKYKLTNVGKEGLELDGVDDADKQKEAKEKYADLKDWLKDQLSNLIERVAVTTRLVTAPAALVSSTYGWTANMERLVKAQALADPKAAEMNAPRKILEINPDHVLIQELNRRVKENKEDPVSAEIAEMLYETAALTSGFDIGNPARFTNQVLKMMTKSLQSVLPEDVVSQMEKQEPIKGPTFEKIVSESKPKKSSEETHDEL